MVIVQFFNDLKEEDSLLCEFCICKMTKRLIKCSLYIKYIKVKSGGHVTWESFHSTQGAVCTTLAHC